MAASCYLLLSALHCKSSKQKKPGSEEDARSSSENSTYLDALVSIQPLKFPNSGWKTKGIRTFNDEKNATLIRLTPIEYLAPQRT